MAKNLSRIKFSAYYSDRLEKAIKERTIQVCLREFYTIKAGMTDYRLLLSAFNEGIDSRLEGFTESIVNGRVFLIHYSEMHILVRRLLDSYESEAFLLASSICETLFIELV